MHLLENTLGTGDQGSILILLDFNGLVCWVLFNSLFLGYWPPGVQQALLYTQGTHHHTAAFKALRLAGDAS